MPVQFVLTFSNIFVENIFLLPYAKCIVYFAVFILFGFFLFQPSADFVRSVMVNVLSAIPMYVHVH